MTKILIEPKYLDELKQILKAVVPKAQVYAYGSRIDGTAHSGSDLDLSVSGECCITDLKTAIEKSNIPFLIDVVKFENLPESFQNEILKNYVVIQ